MAPGAMYEPQRAMAPGTTRTPSSRVFSGILSWWWKSPTCERTIGSSRKASRIARLARSSTTTWPVDGSMAATRARPESSASTAAVTTDLAAVSPGPSSPRRSHSSSICAGSGPSGAAGGGPACPVTPAAWLITSEPSAWHRRGKQRRLACPPRLSAPGRAAQPSYPCLPTTRLRVASDDVPKTRARRWKALAITLTTALILGIGGCVVFQHAKPFLIGDGCQATIGRQVVQLDSQQAAIAATIAGVGYRRGVPTAAVTVAYATALQESHMHNVDYGDRDSVGIFQQRPSEGWGTPSQLMDPVYAATKFFAALVKVPGYQAMPVYRAAQAVQHSADGTAYGAVRAGGWDALHRLHRERVPFGLVLVHALRAEPGAVRPCDDPAEPHVRAADRAPRDRGSGGRPGGHGNRGARDERSVSRAFRPAGRSRPGRCHMPRSTGSSRSVTPDTGGVRPTASTAGASHTGRPPPPSNSANRVRAPSGTRLAQRRSAAKHSLT